MMTTLIKKLISEENHDIAKALCDMLEIFLIGTVCMGCAPFLIWLAATTWSI
jgi:hypothetical protein